MQTTRSNQDYALPGLGALPVVGDLFKSQQKTDVRSVLVILLRPIVIENDDQWKSLTGEPLDPNVASSSKAAAGAH